MRNMILLTVALALAGTSARAAGTTAAETWAASAQNILGSVEVKAPDAKLATVEKAFNAAAADIGYKLTKTRSKATEAVLTYRGPDDAMITVKLKEFPGFTNIKVRCGILGNDALARELLEKAHPRL